MSNNSSSSSTGIGFTGLLTILFIISLPALVCEFMFEFFASFSRTSRIVFVISFFKLS